MGSRIGSRTNVSCCIPAPPYYPCPLSEENSMLCVTCGVARGAEQLPPRVLRRHRGADKGDADVYQGSDRSTPRKEATNAGRERNIKALKAAGATQRSCWRGELKNKM